MDESLDSSNNDLMIKHKPQKKKKKQKIAYYLQEYLHG